MSLLAVGASPGGCGLLVARFNPHGGLDHSFVDGEGSLLVAHGYGPCQQGPAQLEVRGDGSIIVAAGGWSSRLVEVSPEGRRNRDFGKRGRHGLAQVLPRQVRAMAIDAHGRILIAGGDEEKLALTRFTPAGFLDRGFGRGGSQLIRIDRFAQARAVAVEGDGSIVVAGASRSCKYDYFCPNLRPVVVRYLPSGARDRSFGRGGVWQGRVATAANLSTLALSPGSLTAGGWAARPGTSRDMTLVRLHD